ncbi:MAG: Ku protein [Opitutaceae bacterium]|nr:Ku protein [Opitutaceae bacterium]
MAAIWKGTISFGLVNIPVSLQAATRREELTFRLLRKADLSPVNYKRVAAVDGKEVPWDEIVKGYEFEKDKFVVLKDEDFRRADIEATDTIDIIDFVNLTEIDPAFFDKPYFLVPQKGGAGAYTLLQEVLKDTNRVGIAKVVIRTRQHLAAVRSRNQVLMLELMRFADEVVPAETVKIPEAKAPGKRELTMARALVDQLTEKWDQDRYTDDYRSTLMQLIDEKVKAGGKSLPAAKGRAPKSTNVIDLASVLKESLKATSKGKGNERESDKVDAESKPQPRKATKTPRKAARSKAA